MSVQCQHTVEMSLDGVSVRKNLDMSSDGVIKKTPTIAAALAGTLTTRTDANTGVITCATGHGVLTSDILDVYFEDGKRVGVDVTAVTATTISIDIGTGDDLPVVDSELTFMIPHVEDFIFEGDDLVQIVGNADVRATIVVVDDVPSDAHTIDVELDASGIPVGDGWSTAMGTTNPLATLSVVSVRMSHADSDNARDVRVAAGVN